MITEAQILGLSERLPQFFDMPNLVPRVGESSIQKRLLVGSIEANLRKHPYVIHKSCYDRYNSSKLELAKSKRRKVEQISDPASTSINASDRETRARSAEEKVAFGEQVCLFCLEPDKFNPRKPETSAKFKLMTAAAHKKSSDHVDSFSKNLRMKAEKLQDNKLLRLLDGDVRAKELYYHKRCLSEFNNRLVR